MSMVYFYFEYQIDLHYFINLTINHRMIGCQCVSIMICFLGIVGGMNTSKYVVKAHMFIYYFLAYMCTLPTAEESLSHPKLLM